MSSGRPTARSRLAPTRPAKALPWQVTTGTPAHITAVEITLQPGEQTGWHMHPVPMFGYILEGELTVDYGAKGQRTYRKGDGLMEAMNEAHNGRNSGQGPLKILAVVLGSGELRVLRRRIDTAVYSTGNREVTLRSDSFAGAAALVDAIVAARQAA